MPEGPIPLKFLDLLEGNVLANLASVGAEGKPQVNPVWILWDEERVYISVLDGTRKLANMHERPFVALSLMDPMDSGRYLELRGEVVDIKRYDDLSFVNVLARKYTGADFRSGRPGQVRYRVTIRVHSWTAQG